MSPFYLSDKPSVINISVGRQLFVDNFLIESTNLKRTFHYPEYYSGNPILTPEQDWEKTGTKGAAFAAPFSDGYGMTKRKENTRCGIWQVAALMQPVGRE